MTLEQLIAMFRAAEASKRWALLPEFSTTIVDLGLSPGEFMRAVESTEPPRSAVQIAREAAATAAGSLNRVAEGIGVATREISTTAGATALLTIADATRSSAAAQLERDREALDAEYSRARAQIEAAAAAERAAEAEEQRRRDEIEEEKISTIVSVRKTEHERRVEALEALLAGRPGGYSSLRQAYYDVTGDASPLSPERFQRAMLGKAAGYASQVPLDTRLRESINASTWGSVLGDSLHRRILADYANVPGGAAAWRFLVSMQSFNVDFRRIHATRFGGYGLLPTVAEGAPFNALPTPTDEDASYKVAKRGGTEDLSLEAWVNDDVAAVRRICQSLGRAAALTLNRAVLDVFTANAACAYDSTLLFAAGHNNTTTTALSSTSLEALQLKMRKQARLVDSSDVLGIIPRFLIVAPEMQVQAHALIRAYNEPTIASRELAEPLDVIVAAHYSSATAWFLSADPASCPTIEVAFTGATAEPDVVIQAPDAQGGAAFTADKVTVALKHSWGIGVADHRGLARGNT
jgi:hypothetical protein